MNPPSALAGAMGRERKPFTYTPGGLDLSEIKSERMAQRLMRNAMNQGVPETPTHIVQSPPASSKSAVMPNYNCLPVQVFPTFSLPVNPKTLLRTRSNPDPKEKQLNLTENTKFEESSKSSDLKKVIANSNELLPKCDYNNANNIFYNTPVNYDSSEYTAPVLERNDKSLHDKNTARQLNTQNLEVEKSNINNIRPVYFNVAPDTPSIKSNYGSNVVTINIPSEDIEQINNKKEEVPVLNIQSKSDDITENVNGDTNAVITLNLPTKKSEAKTEKKVEVVKKTLPDGAIQEVKTTTTKTTIDGRTEITTETETTTFPIDDGEDVEYEVEEEEIEELDEKEENNDNKVIKNGNGKIEEDEGVQEIEEEPRKNICQIITQDEKLESSTKKKVVIIQSEMQNSDAENEEEYDDADEPEEVEVKEVVILKQKTQNTDSVSTQIEESKQTSNDENETEDDKNINDYKSNEVNITQNGHVEIKNNGETEEEEIEEEEEDGSQKCEEDDNIEKEEQESEQLDEEVEEEYEEAEEAEKLDEPEKAEKIEKVEEVVKIEETEKAQETEKAEEDVNTKIEPEIENCNKSIESNQEEKSEAKQTLKTENDIKVDVENIPIKIITETEKVIENNEQIKEGINLEKQTLPSKINITLTEPFVPLDKVEEVEIKPIGPAKEVITKTHTEIITKTTDKPVGTHSTQTEYNIVENIVTVNRTSKTLEHAYEEIPDNVPTIKTVPPTSDTNFTALSQPILRSHQPVFEPEPQIERRHSLLLERISMDRQMPSEIYQNNYQNNNQVYEDRQYLQEPQSEILIVSNVKPSTISKNQQWYQQNETDNVSNSNIVPCTDIYSNQQHWQNTQHQYKPQTQSQPFYQPKPNAQSTLQTTYQPQPRVQPSPQPLYQVPPQVQHSPQPIYQPKPQTEPIYRPKPEVNPKSQPIYQTQPQVQPTIQPIYHSHPQYQQNYSDNSSQETYKYSSNNYEQTTNLSYPSKPIWTGKIADSQSLPNSQSNHSYLQKDSTELFQKSSQQFSSSYVPPPWEQDCNYAVDNSMQSFYQPPPPKTTLTPSTDWKPSKPIPKFTKPTPTAYIPPAPNQSFVKTANTVQPPKQQGRKTYYSEYERRYISVPETTYIPNETKFQPQPDPSPQYFYDNNEPAESVEPQWRKELREFKEQSSKITLQTEQSNVRPPWEDDPKYAAPKDFSSTPTWTQTLKPRSWRERSYEPEYIGSQELPKTNTLGRGRPQSSYVKNNFDRVPDRTRGVSVDRYNPNNYQSPITREHPPPASHILDPIVQGKTYHNPNVPAYHSRASAEPREQPITYQQPRHRESRATPVQSRSFKYLQWITGTDD